MNADSNDQEPNETAGEDIESTQRAPISVKDALNEAFGCKLKEIPPEEYPPEGEAETEVTFIARSPRS